MSLRDAKPKRKVAVPIPQGLTWIEFLRTVESKLKLSTGIRDVILASTGETVTSLDQLQDIDELFVVEVRTTFCSDVNNVAALLSFKVWL